MKSLIPWIIERTDKFSCETIYLPSGAVMIDVRSQDGLIVIQIDGSQIGLSEVTEHTTPFDVIPDQSFHSPEQFKSALDKLLKGRIA